MSNVLKSLVESRDAAQKAYDDFITPLINAGEVLTDEQQAQRSVFRARVTDLDTRIDEVKAEEERAGNLSDLRKNLSAPVAQVNEPTVYGPGSPNSYFADLARAAHPLMLGHKDAISRLTQAEHEAARELVNGKSEARSRLERMVKQETRSGDNGAGARAAMQHYRDLGQTGRAEYRAMDTTSPSGGSFVTPMYFVGDYAPYRQFGRTFINECNLNDLPDYGMTVYLPHVTSAAGVISQASQNSSTGLETDPTAGYLSANLVTQAGQVTLSQQLIDRAGPNFAFDRLVFDQLNRAYNASVDAYVLNQAIAGAGTVSYTGAFALTAASGGSSFRTKIAQAKAASVNAAGTVLPTTHLFLTPQRWEFIDSFTDSQGRPLTVESYAQPFNAVAAGSDGNPVAEGDTGFKIGGLRVMVDGAIPLQGTTTSDQALVSRPDEQWVWEGDLVSRTIPQTFAQNLSVLLQVYTYVAVIPRYPLTTQVINGTALSAPAF